MMPVDCTVCSEPMTLAVRPRDRLTPLPKNERPTMIPYAFDKRVCANDRRLYLTYAESRMLE